MGAVAAAAAAATNTTTNSNHLHASIKEPPRFISHVAFRQKQHRAASVFVSMGFAVTVIGIALSAMAYGNPTGSGLLGESYDGRNYCFDVGTT